MSIVSQGMKDRNPVLEPISVPKASDILAAKLRDLIVSGKIPAGQSLPTERELVADSNLSRSSVREALRVLEVEGLITTRPGRSGGSTVQLPGRGSIARSMQLFVRSHSIRLEALLETRVGVEPFLAGLAARSHTERELDEMTAIHERFEASLDNVSAYKRINLDWHLAVARASRNEVLIALMEAISQPIFDAADYQEVTTKEIRQAAIRAHAGILKAIKSRDAEQASSRMERHVSAYAEVARSKLMSREGTR